MSKKIYLAGGCFWGVEAFFKRINGVIKTTAGYANGSDEFKNPSYEMVCDGYSGYAETVEVVYDPDVVTLQKILNRFFSIIDPTSVNRQGGDKGEQYRTGIYYKDETDRPVICKVVYEQQKAYEKEIVTQVEKLKNFYPAEDYHKDYLGKNPQGYCHIDLSKAFEDFS